MPKTRLFDHIVIAVDSLNQAAERYEALGFTLTPRAYHEERMGTSNRLAQFSERNFIELLEVDRPDGIEGHAFDVVPPRFSFGAHNKAFLTKRHGMSALVLTTEDARADQKVFEELGLDTYEPFHFERKAKLPDGTEVTVAFTLVFVTSPNLPDLAFFVCQQHAPQYFWKPEYQGHENGAQGLAAVYIAAEDPASHVDFLTKLMDGKPEAVDGGYRVFSGGHDLLVMTPEHIRAALPGCGLEDGSSPSLAGVALRSSLEEPRVVSAQDACGLFLEWRKP